MAQVMKNKTEKQTYISYIQSQSSSATFPQSDTSPQTPPVLLDLNVFTYLNYEGLHTVKPLNIKKALKGYFLTEAHSSAFSFSCRYDCYSADTALRAPRVKKVIAVLNTVHFHHQLTPIHPMLQCFFECSPIVTEFYNNLLDVV